MTAEATDGRLSMPELFLDHSDGGTSMKSLRQILSEKERELVALQREIEVLRAAERIVDKSGSASGKRRLSQPRMIEVVLREHGHPLHADKLAEALREKFGVKLKRSDITSLIYRAIRGKKLFRKAGTNTFGLVQR